MPKKAKVTNARDRYQELANNARIARAETLPARAASAYAIKLPHIVDKRQLLEIVPASYVTILAWINEGKLPRPHVLFGRNIWYGAEIAEVLNRLPLRRIRSDPS
jgi:hypothetical protein